MENLLKEEIERYRRLSFYDTKKTLTENTVVISEQFSGFRDLEGSLRGGVFKSVEEFIAKKMKFSTLEFGEIAALLGKSNREFAMELESAIAKDIQAGVKNGMGPAFKEMSKVDVLRKMAQESKFKGGKALSMKEIDSIIDKVAGNNKIKASEFAREAEGIGQGVKEGEDAFKKVTDPNKKKWNWKRLLKWGAGLGIGAGALYYIYKKTHNNTPPPVVPPVPPVPVPPVPPVPPRPSQYRSCPDTFPIAQFCKNETVRKVQGCLGITADAKFGPNTKTALEGKGLSGTSITQDTVNKVCNTNTSQVNPDVEDVDGQDPNTI
jgi:hypothetical protein